MKKPVLALILMIFSLTGYSQQHKGDMHKPFIFSQQFKHSAGIGAAFYRINDSQEPCYAISYSPTLSLTKSLSDFSITIGSQINGGYHFASSVDDSAFMYADLPLLVEFNFGHNASKDFYSDAGWFLGGGYSFNLLRGSWQQGPEATLGFRAFVFGPSFTIRLSRFFAIRENDLSLNTVTLSLNLGNYFEKVKLNNKVSRFSDSFRHR